MDFDNLRSCSKSIIVATITLLFDVTTLGLELECWSFNVSSEGDLGAKGSDGGDV
jgi:hypothetical protein